MGDRFDPHLMNEAIAATPGAWCQVQGLSPSEHFGDWTGAYAAAANYLVSDSDYVEVLTEIDIQTPIPAALQAHRAGRSFLFLGCRFDNQLTRCFARQIMKRSSDHHWAVLPEEPTRMEARFLQEQNITGIAMPLAQFSDAFIAALQPTVSA
jgi:hypothetical protein